MDDIEKIIWIEGLKNALQYGGKANIGSIMGKIMAERVDLRARAKEIKNVIFPILSQINALDPASQKAKVLKLDPHALDEKETVEEEKTLPDLPNAIDGQVVMRLAPFPSGALHIGNARMCVLNDEYVKRYNGKLLLVFDDTIGTTKAKMHEPNAKYVLPEAYDLIPEGLDWLGVKYHETYYKSDRVEIYQTEAGKLIDQGQAYVCTCPAAVFSTEYKRPGKECPCRNKPIEYHQEMYEQMQEGKIAEGGAVVRMKTGMDQKDPALRDHIIMRISDAPHPRIGTKVRLWPVLEWSWGLDDHLLGMTHIIRGIDLRKEGIIEKYIWDLYGWDHPDIQLYGRLKFDSEFKLSKTFTRQQVKNGVYDGYGDPRSWSLQSLDARGIHPDALRKALLDLGMSKRGIVFDKDWVYSYNRTLIDDHSNRYWFVENPHAVSIRNLPDPSQKQYIADPLLNPNDSGLGKRKITFPVEENLLNVYIASKDLDPVRNSKGKLIYPPIAPDQIIRFKDLFNVKVVELGEIVKANYYSQEVLPDTRKIQVIPQSLNVPVKILQPDGKITQGFGEQNLLALQPNTSVQFERYGYVNIKKIAENEIYGYYIND